MPIPEKKGIVLRFNELRVGVQTSTASFAVIVLRLVAAFSVELFCLSVSFASSLLSWV